ncbi:MAG: hypothetical protein B1H05_04975 [Candidatus Cloacimonas sp. 4484_140]|nr:MAG: hypothetical protein B1H05_04975 [Candidatus Cloacimonas sp. 4484_140]
MHLYKILNYCGKIKGEYLYSKRKKIYSDDIVSVISDFKFNINIIKEKLGCDSVINQGLFLMSFARFEDTIRKIIKIILVSFPEKVESKTVKITRKDISKVADNGYEIIIDNELYQLFKNGVKYQLEYLFSIMCNINWADMTSELRDSINKCNDISLYRNSLIHNGGIASKDLCENAVIFKVNELSKIEYSIELINKFLVTYLNFSSVISEYAKNTYDSYSELSNIDKLRNLWNNCFSSPLLNFDKYWEYNESDDLITNIKYPDYENSISSSEKVLLSIWRHQYYDGIKTEEFLLCSINYHEIYKLYKGLSNLKFYYMYQNAQALGYPKINLNKR